MRLSDFEICQAIGPALSERLEKFLDAASPNLYYSARSDVSLHEESGDSRDGYISFCDGAVTASVLLENSDSVVYAFEKAGADAGAIAMINANAACDMAAGLMRAAEETDIEIPDLDWISWSSFLKNPEAAWKDIENAREALDDPELDERDNSFFRLSLGCVYNSGESDPFYLYVSANFDAPYFRTYSEIRRDAGPNAPQCDFLLAETSGAVPESEKVLSAMIGEVMEKAFPDLKPKTAPRSGPKA